MLIPKPLVTTAIAVGTSSFSSPVLFSNLQVLSRTTTTTTLTPWLLSSSPSSTTTTTTALAGVAAHHAAVNLARVKTRLEGLHSYGVIATLLMNAALRLYSSTPKITDPTPSFENVVKFLFTVTMVLSVLTGSYTTIVFALLELYSKRALGLGWDDKFVRFFDATEDIRESGFDAFIVCLATFKISFCLSLFLNYKGRLRWGVLAFTALLSAYAWWKWSTIMSLASTILFSS